jgi:hypothetical protein
MHEARVPVKLRLSEACDFIGKPFSITALAAKLETMGLWAAVPVRREFGYPARR